MYYTVSARDILAPVAEAISQFVIINANVERSSAAMPDLRELAAAVADQAVNLVDVSNDLAKNGDEVLKKEFPPAGEIVLNASNLCKLAAEELFKDPYGGGGRKKIIEGANGILTGTGRMLLIYDDSIVRDIVKKGQEVRGQIDRIKPTDAPEVLVQLVKQVCDSLVQLTKMCREREEELLSVQQRQELHESLEKLSRQTPIMIGAIKAAAVHPKSKPLNSSKTRGCEDLYETVQEIERIVQLREWNDPSIAQFKENKQQGLASNINSNLVNVLSDTQRGLRPKEAVDNIAYSVENLFGYINNLTDDVNELPLETSKEVNNLKASADESLSKLRDNITQATNLNSPNTQKSIQDSLLKVEKAVGVAEELRDTVVLSEARVLLDQLKDRKDPNTALSKVSKSICENDGQLDAHLKEYQTTADRLQHFLDVVRKQAQNPDADLALRNASEELGNILVQFMQMAQAVKENGKASPSVTAHVEVLSQGCEQLTNKLDELIFNKESLVDGKSEVNAHAFAVEKYENNLASNPAKVAQQLKFTADRLALIADREAIIIDDLVQKKKLQEYSKTFEKYAGNLEEVMNSANNQTIVKKVQPMNAELTKTIGEFQTLMNDAHASTDNGTMKRSTSVSQFLAAQEALQKADEVDGNLITVINDEEVEIIDAEGPAPLDPQEAEANPIKAAAHDLKLTTSQWSKTNRLVELSEQISEHLGRVSSVYREENLEAQKDLVELVKHVHQSIKELHSEAQRVAESCSDKVLKLNIQRAMESLPTLSTQLKILGAVKATAHKDRDSERQLIICAKNLATAAKNTLNCAESCSIRTRKMLGKTASATKAFVKFRRILYTKGSRSPDAQKKFFNVPVSPVSPVVDNQNPIGAYRRTPNITIPSEKKSSESLAGLKSKPNSIMDLNKASGADQKPAVVDLRKSGNGLDLKGSTDLKKSSVALDPKKSQELLKGPKSSSVSNIVSQMKNSSIQKP